MRLPISTQSNSRSVTWSMQASADQGPARAAGARIEAAPFPMAMWEMDVAEVEDQSWEPVVASRLACEWTGPQADVFRRIEEAVLAELRDRTD